MDSLLECGALWDLALDQELPCLLWDLEGLVDLSQENVSRGSDEIPAVSVSKLNCLSLTEVLVLSRSVCCSLGCREVRTSLTAGKGREQPCTWKMYC